MAYPDETPDTTGGHMPTDPAPPEAWAALREPFPPELVGKLPKPYKKDSPKGECQECGGYHGLPAMHLDYVGHAATTDRLLQVDPYWTWEPFATDERGLPAYDSAGGLWIRLTILGKTLPGYGDGASTKECIGDAIRNAAMRFGVALDLWHKEGPMLETKPETPAGWDSLEDHDDFRAASRERVKALPLELQGQVGGWLSSRGLRWPMTRDDARDYEKVIAAHEERVVAEETAETSQEVFTETPFPSQEPPPMTGTDERASLVATLQEMSTEDLTTALKEAGLALGGSKDVRVSRLANHILAA